MATYFEFDKKHPHISFDDIYIKAGKIDNTCLVFDYSNPDLDSLSISLSDFNNYVNINSAKLCDNVLIFDYYENTRAPISIDISKYDHYISTATLSDNILELKYNDNEDLTVSADLSKFDRKLSSVNADNDVLVIVDNKGDQLSTSLRRYTQNDVIDVRLCDSCKTLLIYRDGGTTLSVDTTEFIKNFFIYDAKVNDKQLVLSYNTDEFCPLSVDLSQYDCYVDDIAFDDMTKTLSISHNNKNIAEDLTVNLSSLDRYNTSIAIDNDNVIKITDNTGSEISTVLPIHDTYISAIGSNHNNHTLTFDYNTVSPSAFSIDTTEYLRNDWISSGIYSDGKLILKHANEFGIRSANDVVIDLPISATVSADAALDINSENAIQNKVVTENFNILSSIFTIDAETSSITSFKMKDCTIPDLIWNVKIENGQLTIDQNVQQIITDKLTVENTKTNMLTVK